MNFIPFNKPFLTGLETQYIQEAYKNGILAGDGPFTKKCHSLIEKRMSIDKALLTHSCTAALEMAAILADINKGDEIIMPSYTFVSTANAFVLRGGVPVFVDINKKTLNIDEQLVEDAITSNTKAIVVVHYAGVSCEMEKIEKIASKNNLILIEDAAQAINSSYKGRELGSIGDIGCLSFHETKNIISGEGGAILLNDPKLSQKAEIIREKGTDRSRFFRGEVDKYTWQEKGSSYLPGDLTAAFLCAQLENSDSITEERLKIWNEYSNSLRELSDLGIGMPDISNDRVHNGHLFYLICESTSQRTEFIQYLKSNGIQAVSHYEPLHSSPAGIKYSKTHGILENTEHIASRLVRLPLWIGVDFERVVQQVKLFFNSQ